MTNKVYFFIPNLIGYTRILLAIFGFYMCFEHPAVFFFCYVLSELLDAVDGHAARYFKQTSNFGAVLDMVTDRCSTTALLVVLSNFYSSNILIWIVLICIDLTSHYAHLYSTLSSGATSHKAVDQNTNIFLRLYYGNKYVLFVLCAANEAMFLGLYLLHFHPGPTITLVGLKFGAVQWFLYFSLPLGAMKQFMNVVQLIQAFSNMAEVDLYKRSHKFT